MGYVGVLVRSKGYVAVTRRNEITMYGIRGVLVRSKGYVAVTRRNEITMYGIRRCFGQVQGIRSCNTEE